MPVQQVEDAGAGHHDAGEAVSGQQDAHAARLQVEGGGVLAAGQRVLDEGDVELAALEAVGGVHGDAGQVAAGETGADRVRAAGRNRGPGWRTTAHLARPGVLAFPGAAGRRGRTGDFTSVPTARPTRVSARRVIVGRRTWELGRSPGRKWSSSLAVTVAVNVRSACPAGRRSPAARSKFRWWSAGPSLFRGADLRKRPKIPATNTPRSLTNSGPVLHPAAHTTRPRTQRPGWCRGLSAPRAKCPRRRTRYMGMYRTLDGR